MNYNGTTNATPLITSAKKELVDTYNYFPSIHLSLWLPTNCIYTTANGLGCQLWRLKQCKRNVIYAIRNCSRWKWHTFFLSLPIEQLGGIVQEVTCVVRIFYHLDIVSKAGHAGDKFQVILSGPQGMLGPNGSGGDCVNNSIIESRQKQKIDNR